MQRVLHPSWISAPLQKLYRWTSQFSKSLKKRGRGGGRGGADFSHKGGGVGTLGGFFKKGSITYFHTNPIQRCLYLSVWCACVCFLFTFLPVLFVPQEEPSLIASNQQTDIEVLQVTNFWRKKNIVKSKFFISVNCSFDVIKTAVVSA